MPGAASLSTWYLTKYLWCEFMFDGILVIVRVICMYTIDQLCGFNFSNSHVVSECAIFFGSEY